MTTLDNEWESFLNSNCDIDKLIEDNVSQKKDLINIPKCGDIYISTKTKIAYLNTTVDINRIFWDIPIIKYYIPKNGIIKKQMKFTSLSKEDKANIDNKVQSNDNVKQTVLSHFENEKTKSEIKYKHVQKISIGSCKKDITSYRTKEKSAFYNCFALIIRLEINNEFKEIHMKVFNTGKLEIPGIQDDKIMHKALDFLIMNLQPFFTHELKVNPDIHTVLINSNFNCGYYINREKLFNLLKYKYDMISMYDPCSYPGIQSKFYYNETKSIQDGICKCSRKCSKKGTGNGDGECREISFMIFRTGSILIVGHCDEHMLNIIYKYIKNILTEEYNEINEGNIIFKKEKKPVKKIRKYTFIQDL